MKSYFTKVTHLALLGLAALIGLTVGAKRKPGGPAGGLWEFPGGKLEAGETPAQALMRELREELSLESVIGGSIGTFSTEVAGKIIELDCYWVTILGGNLHLTSHTESAWVSLHEFASINFATPDIPVLDAIRFLGLPA